MAAVTVYVFGIGTYWFGSVVALWPVGALAADIRSVVVDVDGFAAAAAVFVVDVLAAAVIVVHVAAALVAVDVPAAAVVVVHVAAAVVVVIVSIQTAAVVGFAYALVVGADAACAVEENLVVVAVFYKCICKKYRKSNR